MTGDTGTLRIGFVGSATHEVLPRFRERYPGIELELHEAISTRIMQTISDETLDIGVVRVPVAIGMALAWKPSISYAAVRNFLEAAAQAYRGLTCTQRS